MKYNSIILLGIKHSGKSTQGALLAQQLKCPFIDIDDVITKIKGKTPREIYNEKGVGAFMAAEEDACRIVKEKSEGKQVVIATGGGICDNAPALEELRNLGKFVLISVPESVACDRILKKATKVSDGVWENLPAYIAKEDPDSELKIRQIFHNFYERRMETYNQIADIIFDTKNNSKEENAKKIAEAVSSSC